MVAAAGKANHRQLDLPAHVVVYYVIGLTLYTQVSYREVLRCLLEGVKWLLGPEWEAKVAGKSGISHARATSWMRSHPQHRQTRHLPERHFLGVRTHTVWALYYRWLTSRSR